MQPVRVGLVGCGNISGIYLDMLRRFRVLEVVRCADQVPARAQAAADAVGAIACGAQELLAADDVEVVLNLTIPAVHVEVSLAALRNDKSVYSEKPLGLDRASANAVLEEADARGLLVGCAPDTVLGAGIQTCLQLLAEGAIGEPVGFSASVVGAGPQSWHPDPAFFYAAGAGPLFDMGPYYLTALVCLLGPIHRVSAITRRTDSERVVGSGPKQGEAFPVQVSTSAVASLEFVAGPLGSFTASWDVQHSTQPRIEIYGTAATLSVPDPNTFGGPVLLRARGDAEWREIPLVPGFQEVSRGIGLADMAVAMRSGVQPRASAHTGYHVVDVMQAILESSETARHVQIASRPSAAPALPAGWPEQVLRPQAASAVG